MSQGQVPSPPLPIKLDLLGLLILLGLLGPLARRALAHQGSPAPPALQATLPKI